MASYYVVNRYLAECGLPHDTVGPAPSLQPCSYRSIKELACSLGFIEAGAEICTPEKFRKHTELGLAAGAHGDPPMPTAGRLFIGLANLLIVAKIAASMGKHDLVREFIAIFNSCAPCGF